MIYSYGDTFYVVEVFDTGDTVTVDILDATSDTLIVSGGTATESTAMPGVFKYTFSHIFSSETGIVYSISNGKYTKKGFLIVGGEQVDKIYDIDTKTTSIDTTTTNTNNVINNDVAKKSDVINAALL